MKRTKRLAAKSAPPNPVLAELKKLRDDQLKDVTGGGGGPKQGCGGFRED